MGKILDVAALVSFAAIGYGLTWWSTGWSVSPDGRHYLAMGKGERVPSPYHRRWLLPELLGDSRVSWNVWGCVATILSAVLTALYVGQNSFERAVMAELLFLGLPGIWRLNVRLPVLVDSTAYCVCLIVALLFQIHGGVAISLAALLVVILGSCVKETVPLFASALSLHLGPLAGLVCVYKAHQRARDLRPEESYLRHPVREARKVHDFFDLRSKLLPWGVLILLFPLGVGLDRATLCAVITLVLAYAQLFFAQDNARLYQWAAPAVIAVALQHPPSWIWPVVILGLFNPYRGT